MQFVFDDVIVDNDRKTLLKSGKLVECEPRVFQLLVYFCLHPHEAITRASLIESVWQGRVVSDAAVNRAVGELRKLIEESQSSPKYIQTVSKVGYRFTSKPNVITYGSIARSASHWQRFMLICLLVVVVAICAIVVFQNNSNKLSITPTKIVHRSPLTSFLGSSFNAAYDKRHDNVYYLFKEEPKDSAQIYQMDSKGRYQQITDDSFYYTDVIASSDDTIFAARLNNLEERQCEIVQISKVDYNISTLIDCGQSIVSQLALDSKQNRLIYRNREHIAQPYSIFSFHLNTMRQQQLTRPKQGGNGLGDYIFALNTNRNFLAVIEYHDTGKDRLKVIDLTSNSVILNTDFDQGIFGLLWHDEHSLIYSKDDGLYVFNIADNQVSVIEKSDQFGRLSYGEKPLEMLTERSHLQANIYGVPLLNKGVKNAHFKDTSKYTFTQNVQLNHMPALGNQSNILAFQISKPGEVELHIKPEGKPSYRVSFQDDIDFISAMDWSIDDSLLIASINGGVYVYSIIDRTWQALTERHLKVHHVAFINKHAYYSAEVDGQWNIWRMTVEGYDKTQVTFKGGYSVQGNETEIYYTKFNRSGLFKLSFSASDEVLLLADFPVKNWRHWQLKGNKIYLKENTTLSAFELTSKNKDVVYDFSDDMPSTCHVSHDQAMAACSIIDDSSSNIWRVKLASEL